MRRTFRPVTKIIKIQREAAVTSAAKAAEEKAALEKNDYFGRFLKDVLLNPQVIRGLLFLVGGSSVLYYSKSESNKPKGVKRNEPMGDIVVEKYGERLSKYATSIEIAANSRNPENAQNLREVNELRNQLGMYYNDITAEQLTKIQVAQDRRNRQMKLYAMERNLLNMKMRSSICTTLDSKNNVVEIDEKDAAVKPETDKVPTEVKQLTVAVDPADEKLMAEIASKESRADFNYWARLLNCLTPEQRRKLTAQTASVRNKTESSLLPHTFSLITQFLSPEVRPHVFVVNFKGDTSATQVVGLTEEITAIVTNARPERGDKVVVILNSGGGTVTGYGLAAAQLARVKDANLDLIVCVDEIAASGGYMMASVANTLVASHFSMLGSIGVVASIPNFSERMKREGVDYDEVTAGKYKRTMTPFKPTTEESRNKVQSDIAEILDHFKNHIKQHRPALDIEEVATGEVWIGPAALKLGLCDTLATSEEVLLRLRNGEAITPDGERNLPAEIFFLTYEKKFPLRSMLNKLFSSDESGSISSGIAENDFIMIARIMLQLIAGGGSGSGSGSGSGGGFENGMEQNMAKVYRPDYYFQ